MSSAPGSARRTPHCSSISASETAADGGVIDGATRILWQECADVGMPRAVVVTHLDQPRGNFAAGVENCQLVFGEGVHPLFLPLGDGAPSALIGLLTRTVYDSSGGTRTTRPANEEEQAAIAAQRDA